MHRRLLQNAAASVKRHIFSPNSSSIAAASSGVNFVHFASFAGAAVATVLFVHNSRAIHFELNQHNRQFATGNAGKSDNKHDFDMDFMPELDEFRKRNDIVLFQYSTCPFCNRVSAYLDYYRIPYVIVEVNPVTKKEFKGWSDDYKKVPVLLFNGERLVDSYPIIERLEREIAPYLKSTPLEKVVAAPISEEQRKSLEWEQKDIIPLITANLYDSWKHSWGSFDYVASSMNISNLGALSIKVAGAPIMYMVGSKRAKAFHGQPVRELLANRLNSFASEIDTAKSQFHGGSYPDIVDITLFGVIRATFFSGRHVEQDLMTKGLASESFRAWFRRMNSRVGPQFGCGKRTNFPDIDKSRLATVVKQ